MTTHLPVVPSTQSRQVGPLGGYQIEGMEDLAPTDFAIPRWSVIQPTSRKTGADEHVGQFQRNIDNVFAATLDVVILKISPNRLLWSGDQSDKRPECFSRDGLTGSVYGQCATCQFNPQFNRELLTDRNGGAKVCGYGYNLVVADDEGALALIGAMGTSVRPIKTLNAIFAGKARPPFSALVRFETEKMTNERGKFYVLKPIVQSWMNEEETAAYRQRYLAIRGQTIKDIDEDAPDDIPTEAPNF